MAGQHLRPDTWCRESPERLGRAAAVAVVAARGVGRGTGGQRDGRDRENRSGGGRGGSSGKLGEDGLRRCGRPRPQMFQPTALSKLHDDVVRVRPKGEV